jgi:hypothetical protein
MPKLLVACPVHDCKEYSLRSWLYHAKALNGAPDLLWVNNSGTSKINEKFGKQIKIVDAIPDGTPHERIARSMEIIRLYALEHEYDYWLSIECDVMVPIMAPDKVIGRCETWGIDWLSVTIPNRFGAGELVGGFGLCAFSAWALENSSFKNHDPSKAVDGQYFQKYFMLQDRVRREFMPLGWVPVNHIDHPNEKESVRW